MVSFDVVSLFTSIPLDLTRSYTEELLHAYVTDVPADALLQLLDLCLETNFSFSGQCYQQLKEAPMGLPISGFLAETVMQKLESIAIPDVKPKLRLRYIDDTFVLVKKEQLDLLHQNLNSTFPGIEFTFKTEADGQLPFRGVLVHRKTDGLYYNSAYRKETYSEVILHFESNHPICHKRSSVYSLLNRAKTHCYDEESYRAEMKYLFNLFSRNG
ncbi:unnamed protein product [Schistocephalus solidus]|uniref:Reverse transcriptase domain-containing protein n=1 Tax=Schistocephalus solidus TaxID=70667 RepID=A0A183TST2_SCHSO|nr:unnamed protein product [Schistocephalus solidus]